MKCQGSLKGALYPLQRMHDRGVQIKLPLKERSSSSRRPRALHLMLLSGMYYSVCTCLLPMDLSHRKCQITNPPQVRGQNTRFITEQVWSQLWDPKKWGNLWASSFLLQWWEGGKHLGREGKKEREEGGWKIGNARTGGNNQGQKTRGLQLIFGNFQWKN